MSRARVATITCPLLLSVFIIGCGGSGGTPQAPIASEKPDGGLAASKSIMKMQPPPPPKAGRKK